MPLIAATNLLVAMAKFLQRLPMLTWGELSIKAYGQWFVARVYTSHANRNYAIVLRTCI